MRLRLRALWLAAVLELAGLAWLGGAGPAPVVPVAEAAAFEGQGPVRLEGMAEDVRHASDGLRFTLHQGGHAIPVEAPPGDAAVAAGAWVRAQGRILRQQGRLVLWLEDAAALEAGGGPDPAEPSWADLAENPAAWRDRPLRLAGTVDHGALADKQGHRLALATSLPHGQAATVTGFLAYEPACMCERLTPVAVSG